MFDKLNSLEHNSIFDTLHCSMVDGRRFVVSNFREKQFNFEFCLLLSAGDDCMTMQIHIYHSVLEPEFKQISEFGYAIEFVLFCIFKILMALTNMLIRLSDLCGVCFIFDGSGIKVNSIINVIEIQYIY